MRASMVGVIAVLGLMSNLPVHAATCDLFGGTTRGCVPVADNWRVNSLPQRFPSRLAAHKWAASSLATAPDKLECQYGPLLQPQAPTPCKGSCGSTAGYFPEKEKWHGNYQVNTWGFSPPSAGYPNGNYNACTVASASMDPVCPEGFAKINEYLPGTSIITHLCRPNSTSSARGAERFAGIPDTPGCRDKTTDGCTMGKNPVNLASRTKYDAAIDYQNHSPFPIIWSRSYSSTAKRWTFSYDRSLAFHHDPATSKAYATLSRDDGSTIRYKSDNAGSGSTPWTWALDQGAGRLVVRSQLSETRNANGDVTGLALKTLHDEVERYNLAGQLLSVEGRGGFGLAFDYDADGRLVEIQDDFGRSLQVLYDPARRTVTSEQYADPNDPNNSLNLDHVSFSSHSDRILDRSPSQVTDGDISVYYNYETIEVLGGVFYPRLSAVLQADGTTIDYRYGESAGVESATSGLMTGIVGGDGQRFATYAYANTAGQMASSFHGTGLREIVYSSSQIRDAYGVAYSFSTTQASATGKTGGITTKCPDTICSGARAKSITYDGYGNPTIEIDYNTIETRKSYDTARALPVSITQAYGTSDARTVSYTWHSDFRVPLTQIEPIEIQATAGTRTTTWTYNGEGNKLTETVSNSINSQTRSQSWSYNAAGLLASHTNSRGKVASYTYDASGNLIGVENAKGQDTTLGEYTLRGLVGRITDPNGLQTDLTYDERDRVTQMRRGSASSHWETWSISYLDMGKVGRITRPDGTYTVFLYDSAHDLVEMQDWSSANNSLGKTVFTLDLAGRLTKQESFDANNTKITSRSLSYDTLSRLSTTTGAQSQQNSFGYDANGQMTSNEDPMAHVSSTTLDNLGRTATLVDATTNTSVVDYDPQDNLVLATDARGVSTQYSFNAFSDLIGLSSPDRGTWAYTLDAQGNRIGAVDPRGISQNIVYDDLDRVVSASWLDDQVIGNPAGLEMGDLVATYSYDTCSNGIGRICSKTDWTGTTGYSYDLWGRKVGEAFAPAGEGFTLTTGYSYDAFGRPDAVVYPSGKALTYAYGIDGRISSIAWAGSNLINGLAHQAMGGPVLGWTWGATGLPAGTSQVGFTYDQDGQMSHISDIEEIDVVHNLDGQVTGLGHLTEPDRDMAYSYDTRHRLVNADNTLWSAPMLYTWDAGSNRTSKAWDTDSWVHAYGASSNRLVTRTPFISGVAGTAVSPSYDAMGNLIANGSNTFSYDVAGRMVAATSGGSSGTYQVNAEGLRVRKTVSGAGAIDAFAVYDDQRRRVGTYRPDGLGGFTVDEELVYLPDTWRLIATVRGQMAGGSDGVAWPVLTDHLGSPRTVLDPVSGDVRWTWASKEAFGLQAPNENPSAAGAFVFDARFPGQFLDAETGLFHNGYRDYSPQWGRYVQSDPIGLEAGWNTYEYVGGDPVGAFDPLGLSEKDYKETIPNLFRKSIVTMISEGKRRRGDGYINAGLNNLNSALPGNNFEVCVGQSDFMKEQLDNNSSKLDDRWIFMRNSKFGHHWITAYSNNPNDPVLRIDPWTGFITEGVSGYGRTDQISMKQVELWRSPYIRDYIRKSNR